MRDDYTIQFQQLMATYGYDLKQERIVETTAL